MAEMLNFPTGEKEPVEVENNEIETNEDMTLDQLDALANQLNIESVKSDLSNKQEALRSHRENMAKAITGGEDSLDQIVEMLKKFDTVKELQDYLNKGKENVERFFGETNATVDVDFDDYGRELEFKKGFLVYLKESEIAYANIDAEYAKLDEYQKEFELNMKEVATQLADNVLGYIAMLRDKAQTFTDEKKKQNLLDAADYIESGYTYKIFGDTLDNHPSVKTNCIKELEEAKKDKGAQFSSIGGRYLKKKEKHSKASLIGFISDYEKGHKSFEEYILVEGQYEYTDLFVYSLIRWFAMADWSDKKITALHSSVCMVLKKVVDNTIDPDVKADVINAIIDYLKKFN